MKLLVLLVTTMAFGHVIAEPSDGDDVLGPRVVLKVRATVAAPDQTFRSSTTIISNLDEDDVKAVALGSYSIEFLVTDQREGEFSVELTLRDEIGTVLDSGAVLVTPNSEAPFELLAGDVSASGTARIADVIHPNGSDE